MRPILRSTLWLAAAAIVVSPVGTWGRQQGSDQAQGTAQSAQVATQAAPAAASGSSQTDSLADAARKARERKKDSKPEKVFTNENIPTTGGISTVGSAPAAAEPGVAADAGTSAKGSGSDEKAWRDKFALLRTKLAQDKADVDVMQRELGVLDVQYYNDPVKAMQQGLTREDINKKTADIEAKKQAIVADQQAIDDAEDDLRKAGGDPGWSR